MAATYLDLTCHIIFATKHRQPWIADPWRQRLHAYIGGLIREHGAVVAIFSSDCEELTPLPTSSAT
jgi:hypothetical protein